MRLKRQEMTERIPFVLTSLVNTGVSFQTSVSYAEYLNFRLGYGILSFIYDKEKA